MAFPGQISCALSTSCLGISVALIKKAASRLTHGPPHNRLDKTTTGLNVGCEALASFLAALEPSSPHLHTLGQCHEAREADANDASHLPRLHVFGHIHEARGAEVDNVRGRVSVNAANQPLGSNMYRCGQRCSTGGLGWQAIVVDLKDEMYKTT